MVGDRQSPCGLPTMLGMNGVNSIPDLEGLMSADMVWVGALSDSHGSRIIDPEAMDAFKHEGALIVVIRLAQSLHQATS
jgi:hypothetical protein